MKSLISVTDPAPVRDTPTPNDDATGDDVISMYVRLRVRHPATARFVTALNDLISKHSAAKVTIVGLNRDNRHNLFTLAIEIPMSGVARRSVEVVAGYDFAEQVFDVLGDYVPIYVADVTEEERMIADLWLQDSRQVRTMPSPVERITTNTPKVDTDAPPVMRPISTLRAAAG